MSSVYESLLNILKELADDGLKCSEVLRMRGAVVAKHLGAKDAG